MTLDEHDFIGEELQNQIEEKKELMSSLTENLLDTENPERISFITPQENDILSLLKILGKELYFAREAVGLDGNNILLNYVNQNLITRFSIKGERSKQLVNVLNGAPQDLGENQQGDLGKILKEKFKL